MVNSVTSLGSSPGNITTASDRAGLTSKQFMKILTTQLANQNPLQPLDDSQFIQQMVALQNLDSSAAITDAMSNLNQFLQLGSASSMIGKIVAGKSDTGFETSGLVTGVLMDSGKIKLVLNNQDTMLLSGVQAISPNVSENGQ